MRFSRPPAQAPSFRHSPATGQQLPVPFCLFVSFPSISTRVIPPDLPINTYTRNEICSILGTTTVNMAGKSLYHHSLLQARRGKTRYLRRGLGIPRWNAREKGANYIRTSHQCSSIEHVRRTDQGNVENIRIGDAQLTTKCPIKRPPGHYLLPYDTADGSWRGRY